MQREDRLTDALVALVSDAPQNAPTAVTQRRREVLLYHKLMRLGVVTLQTSIVNWVKFGAVTLQTHIVN